jgi:hypothetical protein
MDNVGQLKQMKFFSEDKAEVSVDRFKNREDD